MTLVKTRIMPELLWMNIYSTSNNRSRELSVEFVFFTIIVVMAISARVNSESLKGCEFLHLYRRFQNGAIVILTSFFFSFSRHLKDYKWLVKVTGKNGNASKTRVWVGNKCMYTIFLRITFLEGGYFMSHTMNPISIWQALGREDMRSNPIFSHWFARLYSL